MNHHFSARGLLAATCMISLASQAARADITIEQRMSVEGAGVMAMANMTGTSVTSISGDKAHMQHDVQMQSRMMRMFARGIGPTGEIVRLDQDKVFELDLKKKE